MNQERRSETSIGARMRGTTWGAWANPNASAGIRTSLAEPAVASSRILIVGTDAARQACREALSVLQAQLLEAASAGEAVAAAREHPLALIVLHAGLADANVIDLASLLRVEGAPMICVLPAGASLDQQHNAYQAGVVDCMVNEPDTAILRQKARVFVDLFVSRAQVRAIAERAEGEKRILENEARQLQAQRETLLSQATHDPLTGLPNRLLFEDRLDGAIKRAIRNRQHVAVALVNLDGFKHVNEHHSYATGDELLSTISKRLIGTVRASDTVARLGADEFAVVMEGLHSPGAADYLAHKIAASIARPCMLLVDTDGKPVELTPAASIGVAVFPHHGKEREDLVSAADTAMREAKRGKAGAQGSAAVTG